MFRRALVLFASAVLAGAASAQTVDEILARHFEARGGLEKLKSVKTMRIHGKMVMGQGMEAPLTIEAKRPNLNRVDFTFQGLTGTQAYDGKSAWMVMPFTGKKDAEPIPPEEAKAMEENADFDGLLVDWKAKGHTVELVGKDPVEGADAWRLKVTHKNGNVHHIWLDAETFLQIKQESKRTMRGTEVEGEALFSDFKEVGGMMMAHAMEQGAKGAPQRQRMVFEKIELNPEIPDARFAMPAPAPADTVKASAPADSAKAARAAAAADSAKAGKTGAKKPAAKAPPAKPGK